MKCAPLKTALLLLVLAPVYSIGVKQPSLLLQRIETEEEKKFYYNDHKFLSIVERRHDIRQIGIRHNDTWHNYIWHNGIQHNSGVMGSKTTNKM